MVIFNQFFQYWNRMKKANFKRTVRGGYLYDKCFSDEMCLLALFLDDIGDPVKAKDYLNDTEFKFGGTNSTNFEQTVDTVTLIDAFPIEPENAPYFTIPKKE